MFKKKFKLPSLISHLQKNSSSKIACIHLKNADKELERITYAELNKKARAVAVYLQTLCHVGDRIALVYPSGIDFIIAFVGCLYAGVIAVPLDDVPEDGDIISTLIKDANACGILTTEKYSQQIKESCAKLLKTRECFILDSQNINFEMSEKYKLPAINDETVAYLQYTPSYLDTPKGVVVKHKNLNHSLKFTTQIWRYNKKSIVCNILPFSETQGLVTGLLVPLYANSTLILLSPDVFKIKPITWLNIITKFKVTHSGGFNSSYDLCVNHIEDAEAKRLALQSWKVAFNTGENLSNDTIQAFIKKFTAAGFQPNHISSTYTLVEAVGVVSTSTYHKPPTVFNLNIDAMKKNDVLLTHKNVPHRKLVGNGHLLPGLDAIILDSEKNIPLKEGKIGQICLSGESIVDEYWNWQSELTHFNVKIHGLKGNFFKTGDLGFIKNGEICVVANLKNIITIEDKKHYPLDLEATASVALHLLPVGSHSAIFSIPSSDHNKIIFLQEIKDNQPLSMQEEITRQIRRAILQRHNVNLTEVILVKENSLPVSPSGKMLYGLCRQHYLNNKLSLATFEEIKTPTKINVEIQETTPVKALTIKKVKQNNNDIAVIGMSGLFPGASNLNEFWENLLQGHNPVATIPSERWSWKSYFGESHIEDFKEDLKWGAFLKNISEFDADFFGISPREAELMDPQQRLFLQMTWSAIEDAGYSPTQFAHSTVGVFVGAASHDYAELLQGVADVYTKKGLSNALIANRVSNFFNLKGPSEVVNAEESSSLVALHHALRAMKTGDCDISIVGGVHALLTPTSYLTQSKCNLLSATGQSRVFDKDLNGYVQGEGVGVIILKPLNKAIEHKDHIYGVIKGSAINHGTDFVDLFQKTKDTTDIQLNTLSYIETSADGSFKKDVVELNELLKSLSIVDTSSENFTCGIGSVKSNVGNLNAASGIAGIIKILLSLKHKQLPGTLHFDNLHSEINLSNSFYILDKSRPWLRFLTTENVEIPLRACINSVSSSGVNVNAVFEEYLLEAHENFLEVEDRTFLLTLSAKTEAQLKQRIIELHDWLLVQREVPSLAALSYTLNVGRCHFDKRCAIVADTTTQLLESLQSISNNQEPDNVVLNLQDNKKAKWRPVFQTLFRQLMQEISLENNFSQQEYRNKLLAIGNFYTEGYEIPWNDLYKYHPQRLSLPAYPFAKTCYWVPSQAEILEFTGEHQKTGS